MRRELVWLCLATTIVLVTSACFLLPGSPAQQSISVEASCDDFAGLETPAIITRTVEIGVGETLSVVLCANPTTGFSWEEATIADPDVLQQVDHRFEPPTGDRAGAAGEEVWSLRASTQGSTTFSTQYSRPWASGEKGVWQFRLDVNVR